MVSDPTHHAQQNLTELVMALTTVVVLRPTAFLVCLCTHYQIMQMEYCVRFKLKKHVTFR